MKLLITISFFAISIALFGQNDSIYCSNIWSLSVGCDYHYAKIATVNDYLNGSYNYNLTYNYYNGFSPEINIIYNVSKKTHFLNSFIGLKLADNFIKYKYEGIVSGDLYPSSGQTNTTVKHNQYSISPLFEVQSYNQFNKKTNLLFSINTIFIIPYYNIIIYDDKISDKHWERTYWENNLDIQMQIKCGIIFKRNKKLYYGFVFNKQLFSICELFAIKNELINRYYDQIGCSLLIGF